MCGCEKHRNPNAKCTCTCDHIKTDYIEVERPGMKTIHKYVLNNVKNEVQTFEGAKFLHVDNQRGEITVWAEVDTRNRKAKKILHVVGTGNEVPEEATKHLGSAIFSEGMIVFHIYEDRTNG